MFYITKQNLPSLLLGSLFCGTGGGLPYKAHKKIFDALLEKNKKLSVRSIEEFKPQEYLATVYGVGDSSKPIPNVETLLKEALKEYERLTGRKIHGILPGEIGAEGVAFQAGAYLNLPLVDSDLVGGRASPEIQMDAFSAYHIPITPVLGSSINDKRILLMGAFLAKGVEDVLRGFFKGNGGVGILVGYPIKAKKYQGIGMQNTISRSIKFGEYLTQQNLNGLLKEYKGEIIAQEKIHHVTLKSEEGFLQGWIEFGTHKIWVKNENIALYRGRDKKILAPDMIALVSKKGKPIHNSEAKNYKNKEVSIVHLPAFGYWKQADKRKLWESALPTGKV